MVTCNLPYYVCSQRFTYINDLRQRTTSQGLRLDMRRWIKERTGELPRYELCMNGTIDFKFETRGMAALFKLRWMDADQILNDPPVDRALIDQI